MHGERGQAIARNVAKVPATVGEGFRFALGLFAHPSRGGLAVIGAAGFWAANIGILWASFQAFGVSVPLAVVVQGFFLGMVAIFVPIPLMFLAIIVILVQTLVFCLLASIYIGLATEKAEHH